MSKLISWYNQNRKIIWLSILVIIGVIALIQTLNNYYKTNSSSNNNTNITTTSLDTNYSIISEEKIEEKTSKEQFNIINNFIDYCNNSQIENAYFLLSSNCKEELYPDLATFKSNYFDRIFVGYKDYNVKAWIVDNKSNTYRIELRDDILASGKVSENFIEEYYTIVKENGGYKLNIAGYIGKEYINKTNTINDITIKVISKQKYMEYEKYNILINNNSNNNIFLDSKEKTTSTYLLDSNEVEYISYNHELLDNELLIRANSKAEITIKFNKTYKPSLEAKQMIFADIILNYDEYINQEVKEKYTNRLKINIDI